MDLEATMLGCSSDGLSRKLAENVERGSTGSLLGANEEIGLFLEPCFLTFRVLPRFCFDSFEQIRS